MNNNRINVIPTKSVGGVRFGASRVDTRREFGKFNEFRTESAVGDDFGYMKAYYNESGQLESVEITGRDVFVGGSQVYPTLDVSARRMLEFNEDDKSYSNSIEIESKDGKLKSIKFGKAGAMGSAPKTDDKKDNDAKQEAGEPDDLTRFYDDLKSRLDNKPTPVVGYNVGQNPNQAAVWRNKAVCCRDKLVDDCRKHIILDIYCKILPLDDDYKQGHIGQMQGDVDNMLASRGMSATQYLTSASNATKAPLLEYLLRATDLIGQQYMEAEDETLNAAKEKDIGLPEPEAPGTDDPEIQDQLVDVTADTEYDSFVDQLKKKTIDKIVSDVTKIIDREKDEADMEFDPKPEVGGEESPELAESAVMIALNHIQGRVMTEGTDIKVDPDKMLAMAIREATVNSIDRIFNIPESDCKCLRSRLRYNEGSVITESLITEELIKGA